MPKFTPFEMTDAEYDKLHAVATGSGLGGLCVAISLEWLERIYRNKPATRVFRTGEP